MICIHLGLKEISNRQRRLASPLDRVSRCTLALSGSRRWEGYPAQVARGLLFDLEAWDINCKQHIPLRFDEASL